MHDVAAPCFFCPVVPREGEQGALDKQETRHASTSRRIRVGGMIGLIDGAGVRASAVVDSVSRWALVFTVLRRRRMQPAARSLVVLSAVPKGDRFRLLIDMLSQIGVTAIAPLQCEYSTVKPKRTSVDRWRRIAIEACKQSRNPYLPKIHPPLDLRGSLALVGQQDTVIYADPRGSRFDDRLSPSAGLYLYIGPEGGFTDAEKRLLHGAGGRSVSLGTNVLRIETAAVAGAVLGLLATS